MTSPQRIFELFDSDKSPHTCVKMIFFSPSVRLTVIAVSSLILASCASKPSIPTGKPTPSRPPVATLPPPKPPTPTPPAAVTHSKPQAPASFASFDEWRQNFLHRHPDRNMAELLRGARLNERVISLDKGQAEFVKMPWEYIESAVSSSRVSQGKSKLNGQRTLLLANENLYGVPASIATAIWGLESSYGAGMGSMDLVSALSSLAYDGRRRDFAESQLLALRSMINRGDVNDYELKGSWAGGMGHTQFIPSTWLEQGVDGNGDGKKNPWSTADALTSTANYLANAGWVRGLPTFFEVRLPSGFNYTLLNQKQPLDAWRALGITTVGDAPLSGSAVGELWMPAGANGPVLITTQNFDVIRVYNNSTSYALAVSLLAKRINGESGIVASWPYHEQALSNSQIRQLQQRLNDAGYDTKGIDGIAGANTRSAFARWQADNGRIPDGFISQSSARDLLMR